VARTSLNSAGGIDCDGESAHRLPIPNRFPGLCLLWKIGPWDGDRDRRKSRNANCTGISSGDDRWGCLCPGVAKSCLDNTVAR
jgi:hypothetical protein